MAASVALVIVFEVVENRKVMKPLRQSASVTAFVVIFCSSCIICACCGQNGDKHEFYLKQAH